jgi:hypothetical protein
VQRRPEFPPKVGIFINLIKSPRMGKALSGDARIQKTRSQIEIEKHSPMQIINMQKAPAGSRGIFK